MNGRKRGGREVLTLLRMHAEDSVGKVRTELMLVFNVLFFWVYTAGNEEGFKKGADSTVILYCELELATQKSN